jgi:hypothetical protein
MAAIPVYVCLLSNPFPSVSAILLMSSQNNEEVFFLDDIGSPPSAPPRGLTSSPVQTTSTTPTETANSSRGSSPTASPHRSVVDVPSIGPGQNSPVLVQPNPPTILGPPVAPTAKPTPTSSTLLGSSPLLHKRPIHATPSAPSPLARASIVPNFSDCDSSSNDSAILSDEEEGEDSEGRGMEFKHTGDANARFALHEKFSLGSPRNQASGERTTVERAGTGTYGGVLTPGSLLRGKRSDSGSSQSQASSSSGGISFPSQREYGHAATIHAPLYGGSPLSNQSYPRQRSESFGSSMDPLMVTSRSSGARKRSDSIGSVAGRPGGMSTGPGSALGFSTTIAEQQRTLDKGKEREVWPADTGMSGSLGTSAGTSFSLSPKASPRRERVSVRASSSLTGERYDPSRIYRSTFAYLHSIFLTALANRVGFQNSLILGQKAAGYQSAAAVVCHAVSSLQSCRMRSRQSPL